MKYAVEIEIDLPISRVVELFDDPDNLKKWQPGLERLEHIEGTPGQPGAKTRLLYNMGKRRVEMIETIKVRNLPEEFSGMYETDGVVNTVINRFSSLPESKTRWTSEQEFKFDGWAMKMMAFFMPGAFKKQSRQYLQHFKNFAEREAGSHQD